MNASGGRIEWVIDADKSRFDGQLAAASASAGAFGGQLSKTGAVGTSFARDLSNSFNTVADSLGQVLKVGAIAGVALGGGMFLAAKAAFSQVDAVQQATVALNAYETDATKVNSVLKDLVSFARSDMGVLFNRKDLFASAQGLKIMGDSTENLTGHVKIMARSVGLGLSTFEELTQVIGRVGSTSHLTGIDFDNLTKAGFKLDPAIRNTDITFAQLFEHLDRGIPVSALTGQANTIRGLGVRLETAFRGVGEAILGVNSDTGKFVAGGLGDKLVGMFTTISNALKDPALLSSLRSFGKSLGDFAQQALPVLISGITFLLKNLSTIIPVFAGIAVAFGVAKIAAIGFGIAANVAVAGISLPFLAIAAAIAAVVAVLTFLQLKFNIFGKVFEFIRPALEAFGSFFNDNIMPILKMVGDYIGGVLSDIFKTLGILFGQIGEAMKPLIAAFAKLLENKVVVDMLKGIALAAAAIVFGPLIVAIGFVMITLTALSNALKFVSSNFETIKNVITTIFSILSIPLVIAINIAVAAFNLIRGAIGFVIDAFNNFMIVVQVVSAILAPILDFIRNLFIIVFGTILIVVINAVSGIRDFIVGAWNLISGVTNAVFNAILGATIGIWSSIFATITGVVQSIINFFAPAFNWLIGAGRNIIMGLINGISSVIGTVTAPFSSLVSQIRGFFAGAAGWLVSAGADIIRGLVNGIKSMAGAAADAAADVAKQVESAAKNLLKIKSPSQVFMSIGRNVSVGLAQGISQASGMALSATSNMANSLSSAMDAQGTASMSMAPSMSEAGVSGGNANSYHIGVINIASEVDGERWLQKLTRDQEIISNGMIPSR